MRRLTYLLVVVFALAAAGCGTSSKSTKKSKSKKERVTRQVEQVDAEAARQAAAREEEARRMAEIRSYMEQGKQNVETAMADELAQKIIEVDMVDDRTLRLTLSNAAAFDVGSAALKKAAINTLHDLAEVVVQMDKTMVTVVGHTDNSGKAEANASLSQKRADAVMGSLAKHNVPVDRMVAEGRGDQEPRDTNATKEGRANNRRVEMWLRYAE